MDKCEKLGIIKFFTNIGDFLTILLVIFKVPLSKAKQKANL